MKINKALRKQRKSYKRFMLSMGFVFVLFPSLLYVTRIFDWHLILLLVLVEILCGLSMVTKYKELDLKYEVTLKNIKIMTRIPKRTNTIPYDAIKGVHFSYMKNNSILYIIVDRKLRGKVWKRLNKLSENDKELVELAERIQNVKEIDQLFYLSIVSGGFIKQEVLSHLYVRALDAFFSKGAMREIASSK